MPIRRKIFVTGGHFDPAQAVIQKLTEWETFYLGRRFSMEGDRAEALEYQEIQKLPNIHYLVITTGRIQPKFFIDIGQSLTALFKIFVGLGQSLYFLVKYRPDVVLSFGGYVAFPIVFIAWLLGIPVATHEQTLAPGRANRLISLFSDKTLVSWPDSCRFFPQAIVTGNPIRQEILATYPKPAGKRPKIYVTGGNQGAHVLNAAVEAILPQLLAEYEVWHQTGAAQKFADYSRLAGVKNKYYHVAKFFSAAQVGKILHWTDLVVTRAGANITKEILALGKMAIFVPIPWSAGDEQALNAQKVKALGLAEILPQEKLTGEALWQLIALMFQNKQKYLVNRQKAKQLVDEKAADKIVSILEQMVSQ